MNALHPVFAQALAPFAPRQPEVAKPPADHLALYREWTAQRWALINQRTRLRHTIRQMLEAKTIEAARAIGEAGLAATINKE